MKELFDGNWPEPKEVENMGEFSNIRDFYSFNKIIGNPDNWSLILERRDLFESWILPSAILYVGKSWYKKVKNSKQIAIGIPFPLIRHESQERATIAKIAEKTSSVLIKYLEGEWYKGKIKKPSGYIIEALKNKFAVEIGKDLGFKQKSVLICPYCVSSKVPTKVLLDEYTNKIYSCPKCKSFVENFDLDEKEYKSRKTFEEFIGITCICPNDKCSGKFVPIPKKYFNISVKKNIQSFQTPPDFLLNSSLTCPHCETIFTPKEAIEKKSGFKNMSGYLTGLPSVKIWEKEEIKCNKVPIIINEYYDDIITIKQHLNIIINELIIQISKTGGSNSGLLKKYFLLSVINWIVKYGNDANLYFFKGKTKGKYSIHRKIFDEYITLLEENINEFGINKLEEFRFLARPPKFSGGPRMSFEAVINNNCRIPNKTNIIQLNSSNIPKIVKVCSIKKNGRDFTNEIDSVDFNSIKVLCNELKVGNKVNVDAIFISGHSSNMVIQRITRLKFITKNVVDKVLEEEKTGERDVRFWNNWEKNLRDAKIKTGITTKI